MRTASGYQAFHRQAKAAKSIPYDASTWPAEWRTIYYKAYPRLLKVKLSRGKPRADFFSLVRKRRSQRDFRRSRIASRDLSLLLQYGCGIIGSFNVHQHRRAQPSGGGRFPIEVYPLVFRCTGVPSGVYHYNVRHHSLDALWQREFASADFDALFTYPWVRDAAAVILMTAVFWRTTRKYGDRGYRYVLHEAGHIGQNLYLTAVALNLKCCALGGTRDEAIEELLDIDGVSESVVYAVAIGR